MFHSFDFTVTATVIESSNQTVTVKGLPFWFTWSPDLIISGTDINIIDYIGTNEIGLLYLSKPVAFKTGSSINITINKDKWQAMK